MTVDYLLSIQWYNLFNQGLVAPGLAVFMSTILIWGLVVGFLYKSLILRKGSLRELTASLLSAAGFYFLLSLINLWWFRPRPFVVGHFVALINVSPAISSFPSGHSALAWLLAGLLAEEDKANAWWFYLLALVVALGRVAVGVHYFSDVLAGAILGWLFSRGAIWLRQQHWFLPGDFVNKRRSWVIK